MGGRDEIEAAGPPDEDEFYEACVLDGNKIYEGFFLNWLFHKSINQEKVILTSETVDLHALSIGVRSFSRQLATQKETLYDRPFIHL